MRQNKCNVEFECLEGDDIHDTVFCVYRKDDDGVCKYNCHGACLSKVAQIHRMTELYKEMVK